MSEVNIPALRKAVEWAETENAKGLELSEWHQLQWISDPKSEVYKNMVNMYGADNLSDHVAIMAQKSPECGTCYCVAGYVTHVLMGLSEDEVGGSWVQVAAEELGINYAQADALFMATNTIEQVRSIAEKIAGEKL